MTELGFYGAVRHAQRSNWESVLADARAKRSAVEVVLDDWQLAPLLAADDPRRIVVIRWSWDEKSSDQHPDAALWVRHVVSEGYDPRCYLEIENEPSVPKPDAQGRGEWLAWHASWLVDAMREAERLGVRLAVGNWSTGTPEPGDWARYYAPALHRVATGPHVLAAHVYYAVTPDHPMTLAMMATLNTALAVEPRLAGKTILTETGKDHVDQMPDSPAGWTGDESQELHAARMADFFERWRGKGVCGATEYLWIERFDQNQERWRKFNIAGADRFNALIAKYPYGEWMKPMDMNTREAGTVRPAGAYTVHIRATPGGEDIGDLAGSVHASRTAETQTAGSNAWRHYSFDDPSGELSDGWMADGFLTWTPDPATEPEPEHEPEPVPPIEPAPLPVDALAVLEVMRGLREAILALQSGLTGELGLSEAITGLRSGLDRTLAYIEETWPEATESRPDNA